MQTKNERRRTVADVLASVLLEVLLERTRLPSSDAVTDQPKPQESRP